MKRIAIPALLLVCLGCFVSGGPSNADQEQQEKPTNSTPKKVPNGVQITRFWEGKNVPQWPQVAQLLLSADEYKKYLDAPEDYVNGLDVFHPSSTHKIYGCDYAPAPKGPEKDAGKVQCMVLLKHEHTTTSIGSSSCALEW